MTDIEAETRSVVIERDLPYAPEKIWRALTQPELIAEWLMNNDFEPVGPSTTLRVVPLPEQARGGMVRRSFPGAGCRRRRFRNSRGRSRP